MSVSEFVGSVAQKVGKDGVKGAIVLVALERPLDCLIQKSLGLSCYHPGKPSPFSHTFLISGSFDGPNTPILDCTIRDKNDQIAWKLPLIDSILAVVNKKGKVYSARLGDYDDRRVHPIGVKLIEGTTDADREKIVSAGRDLQALGIHYDFLGLFRELIAMLVHVQLPAQKDMFCSAFCQGAYHNGLGSKGDFLANVDFHDISPDDIWFSRVGKNFPDTMPLPKPEDLCPKALADISEPPLQTSQRFGSFTSLFEQLNAKMNAGVAAALSPQEQVRAIVATAISPAPLPPTRDFQLHYIRGLDASGAVTFYPEFLYLLDVGLESIAGVSLSFTNDGLGDPTFPDFTKYKLLAVQNKSPGGIIFPAIAGRVLITVVHGTPADQVKKALAACTRDVRPLGGDSYAADVAPLAELTAQKQIAQVPIVVSVDLDWVVRIIDGVRWVEDRVA